MIGRVRRYRDCLLDFMYEFATGNPGYMRAYESISDRKIRDKKTEFDLVYVLPPYGAENWILQAICRELDRFYTGHSTMICFGEKVPAADAYFYSHYGYFRDTLLRQPEILDATNVLYYTHPRELWFSEDELLHTFSLADTIVCMCTLFEAQLRSQSVTNTEVVLAGADPDYFPAHKRGSGKIGFCSSYYPRKDGEKILSLVSALPEYEFVLCGRNWEKWEKFDELWSRTNFEYLELEYSEYPGFYATLDVFVSVSRLEGGPIPLIEAMMSNVVPVASDTGHARDLVEHGKNGYLFPVDAAVEEVVELIHCAFENDSDIRATVQERSWEAFSLHCQKLLFGAQ